jgi:hypothetical protein
MRSAELQWGRDVTEFQVSMIVDNRTLGELLYRLLGLKAIILRGTLNNVTSESSLGHFDDLLFLGNLGKASCDL